MLRQLASHDNFEDDFESVKECKAFVTDLVEDARTPMQEDRLSEGLCELLSMGTIFRMSDYYILWKGHEFLTRRTITISAIKALVKKVANRDNLKLSKTMRDELATFACCIIAKAFVEGDRVIAADGSIVWTQWQIVATAVEEGRFEYDEKAGKYRTKSSSTSSSLKRELETSSSPFR